MKTSILLTALTLALAGVAQAGLYYDGTGGAIPDGSLAGRTWTLSAGDGGAISSVSILFNINGGFNNDLYGYLTYNDGVSSRTEILLNHIIGNGTPSSAGTGFGTGAATATYTDLATKAVILTDGSFPSIRIVAPGAGQPVAVGSYNPDSGLSFSSTFGGMSGNGTWTLFLADTSAGGHGNLISWGLDVGVTPVPEPVTVALGCFAGVAMLVGVCRSQRVRKLFRKAAAQ